MDPPVEGLVRTKSWTLRGSGDPSYNVVEYRTEEWARCPELRYRCALLHHGLDLMSDRIQVCGAITRADKRAPLGPSRSQDISHAEEYTIEKARLTRKSPYKL